MTAEEFAAYLETDGLPVAMANAGNVLFVGDSEWKCAVTPQGDLVETEKGEGVARSLTRTWCLFELHLAMLKADVSVEVALPRDAESRDEEPQGFFSEVFSMPNLSLGSDSFPSDIERLPIDVTEAQATNLDDKVKIDSVIANGVGAARMNEQIKEMVFDSHKTAVLAERHGMDAQRGVYAKRLGLPFLWFWFIVFFANSRLGSLMLNTSLDKYNPFDHVWPDDCYEVPQQPTHTCDGKWLYVGRGTSPAAGTAWEQLDAQGQHFPNHFGRNNQINPGFIGAGWTSECPGCMLTNQSGETTGCCEDNYACNWMPSSGETTSAENEVTTGRCYASLDPQINNNSIQQTYWCADMLACWQFELLMYLLLLTMTISCGSSVVGMARTTSWHSRVENA